VCADTLPPPSPAISEAFVTSRRLSRTPWAAASHPTRPDGDATTRPQARPHGCAQASPCPRCLTMLHSDPARRPSAGCAKHLHDPGEGCPTGARSTSLFWCGLPGVGRFGESLVQSVANLFRGIGAAPPFSPGDDHACCCNTREARQSQYLPPAHLPRLRLCRW
jgi:hypothetical protein